MKKTLNNLNQAENEIKSAELKKLDVKTPKLKIADFRRVVYSLDWARQDLTGGTASEFVKQDVGGRLAKHISAVEVAIEQVPARFSKDIDDARQSIGYALKVIERWEERRVAPQKTAPVVITPILSIVH